MEKSLKSASIKGFIWRVLQNCSSQIMSFVIQIILARLLSPSDYGIVSITTVVITILNVFVSTGFASALVQTKDIDEIDKSSMFYLCVMIGCALYTAVFFTAPIIAYFYENDYLVSVLRVQAITVIVSSFYSVHQAIIQREINFKKTFIATIIGTIVHGIVGIWMAYTGCGVWALVWGTLAGNIVTCIVLIIISRWIPKPKFSWRSIKKLFSFSSKVLAGNLLDTIYNNCKTLIIGKAYDADLVGYYNRGYTFPSSMMSGIDGAMTSVLFASLSRIQDNKERLKKYLRKSMKYSLTVVVPLLCGLAAVADPLIRVLLTDKWENSIPFVMIACLNCLTWPLSARNQAINALGKSGTNLLVNISMKIIGIGLILVCIPFGVYVMCLSTMITSIISFVIYAFLLKKHLDYSIILQLFDVLPIYLIGLVMFGIVYSLSCLIAINLILKLVILIMAGILVYVGLSLLFKMDGFMDILSMIRSVLSKKRKTLSNGEEKLNGQD